TTSPPLSRHAKRPTTLSYSSLSGGRPAGGQSLRRHGLWWGWTVLFFCSARRCDIWHFSVARCSGILCAILSRVGGRKRHAAEGVGRVLASRGGLGVVVGVARVRRERDWRWSGGAR